MSNLDELKALLPIAEKEEKETKRKAKNSVLAKVKWLAKVKKVERIRGCLNALSGRFSVPDALEFTELAKDYVRGLKPLKGMAILLKLDQFEEACKIRNDNFYYMVKEN